jgi:hypothetical protein
LVKHHTARVVFGCDIDIHLDASNNTIWDRREGARKGKLFVSQVWMRLVKRDICTPNHDIMGTPHHNAAMVRQPRGIL